MNKVILSLLNGQEIGFTCAGVRHTTNGVELIGENEFKELIQWLENSNVNEYSVKCNANLEVTLYKSAIAYTKYQKVS